MNLIEAKAWAEEMDVRVTVCDSNAIIVYLNKASIVAFQKRGGEKLIGKSLFDCHNPESNLKIREMLSSPKVNTSIINKRGEKWLIRQLPWMENGQHKGIIEISFILSEKFDV